MSAAGLALVLVLLSSSPGGTSPQRKPGCFKVNNCKCIMKDGSGVISLRAMGDQEGFLGRFMPLTSLKEKQEEQEEQQEEQEEQQEQQEVERLLFFSPCVPFSLPQQCSDVAVCLSVSSSDLNTFLNYGEHSGSEFHYNDSLKVLSVSYFSSQPQQPQQPLTVVHYHCNPDAPASFISSTHLSEGPLHIWVESPCACANACVLGDLGLGSIFLIMLCVSGLAYFILGSCALRPFRSRSGVQMSPEPSVWCMICFNCSQNQPSTHSPCELEN